MPNIFHQSVEDILRAATPEQKILWNWVFLTFGERVAISQYLYSGDVAACDAALYSANKMYVIYELVVSSFAGAVAGTNELNIHDRLNAVINVSRNTSVYWDVTAAAMRNVPNDVNLKNLCFSRISGSYSTIKLIGYRLGI